MKVIDKGGSHILADQEGDHYFWIGPITRDRLPDR